MKHARYVIMCSNNNYNSLDDFYLENNNSIIETIVSYEIIALKTKEHEVFIHNDVAQPVPGIKLMFKR